MKLLLFAVFNLIFVTLNAQNPGNIGTANLTAWFRPDALAIGNVTSWTTTLSSLGGVTVTDATAPFPQATNTPPGNVSNYNTTLSFVGNTTANLMRLQNTSSLNLLQNNSTNAQGTFFCAYYLPAGTTAPNQHMMVYNSSPHAIQLRNLGANGRLALGLASTNSSNACRDWSENFTPSIISYRGNRSSATSLNVFENDVIVTNSPASQSSGATGLYFGNQGTTANSNYGGYLHEFIFYNTNLSNADIRKVHSYLAIKYGITLDNAGGGTQGDYTSSDGTTIWDASVNPQYHRDVIGIGRDDNQELIQKQSHSFSDDFRLYISNLQANNVSNTGIFTTNSSFITMGHNTDGCGNTASNAETPATVSSRLGEEWKVQNTKFTQTFNWDVKIDTCNTPGFLVGTVDLASLRLLVDTDGDFSNATVYAPGAGLSFLYNNGYVTVNGISNLHLPEDSIRYFTLGYNTTLVSFSGNNSICIGDSVSITVNIINATAPINVTYNNGTTNVTLTNISNGHVFQVTPTTTTSYTIDGFKSFLNCCGGAGSGVFTINVSPFPVVSANASLTTICAGQSTTISGGGATTYVWSNGIMNGTNQTPSATTTYTVIGQNAAGCADTASITVTVNPLPIVTASSTSLTICQGTPITLSGGGAATYSWTGGAVNNVPFSPNSTFLYTVTGTDANNCTNSATVSVTVNALPVISAIASDSTICAGETITFSGAGGLSYSWNNNVINNVPFLPSASGTFTVTGTDLNNCSNSDDVSIIVNPLPVVIPTATPNTICEGDSSQLLATGATTYIWNLGVSNFQWVKPTATTTYTVIGFTGSGCSDTASIILTVNPRPLVVGNASSTVICAGELVTLFGFGATSYNWTNGVTDNIPFSPATTASYTVTGTDANNCSATATIFVTVVPSIEFSIGPDTTACPNLPIVLSADSLFTGYLWSTGATTPSISTAEFGIISLVVTDINGCSYQDDLLLTLGSDCFPTFVVPNVFSPNGDNVNDLFFIDATNVSSQTITIFNRWSNVMYSSTGILPAWDGKTVDGATASDGVYFVKYSLEATNGEVITGTSFFQLFGE